MVTLPVTVVGKCNCPALSTVPLIIKNEGGYLTETVGFLELSANSQGTISQRD